MLCIKLPPFHLFRARLRLSWP